MKINKELEKQFEKKNKEIGKSKNFKSIRGTLWKVIDGNLIKIMLYLAKKGLVTQIHIKKYSYDDIFWNIMDMKENANERESLRVNGAFTSPTIMLKFEINDISEEDILDGFETLIKLKLEETENLISNFLKNNDINEYVINGKDDTLKCLAYIDSKQPLKAIEVAKINIEQGKSGGFVNGEKCFFEYVLSYMEEKA